MIAKIIPRSILIAMMIWILGAAMASNVNIDYSHNIAGTGTVMTDFEMGSVESTIAKGEVRGTGELMNRYVYLSNNTENVTVFDQFLFTKAQPSNGTALESYPVMKREPGSFRLLGTIWSGRINSLNQKININQSAPY